MVDATQVQAALDAAHRYYRSMVRRSWVFDTLFSRNLADVLKPAEVGWAPRGWTSTTLALTKQGFDERVLLAAGISRTNSDGTVVDVLHDRMTFPIRDEEGHIAGFTGRAGPDADDRTPKYLNTPATERFRKSALLYGLGESVAELRGDNGRGTWPVFVEGTLDRWAMLKAIKDTGLPLTPLAPCGTALTAEHLAAVRRHTTKPFVFAFDGDSAGQQAILRAWDELVKPGFGGQPHRAIELPPGTDPADMVSGHRGADLVAALRSPVPLENRIASIRRDQLHVPDNPVADVAAVAATITADVDAIPVTNITGWIGHLSNTWGLPAAEVNGLVLESVSPTDFAAQQPDLNAVFPGPPTPHLTTPAAAMTAGRTGARAVSAPGVER